MLKAKKYDWKDSNLALFGSDTEKQVKKESAESESAWQGAGQEVGLQIWRINKFKVEHWDKDQYGEFYNGDSYILLNTYKEEEELKYDVHFWIGKYSTQDEYGTAAYKTVELDTFLEDKPIQHREVQGHESKQFKGYFEALTLLKGGADTGFRRVLPESYEIRLMHVKKVTARNITMTQVSAKRGNLKEEDVFIIDNGLHLYQYNGSKCSHDEKFKAAAEVNKIKDGRRGAKVTTLDGGRDHSALQLLQDGESKEKNHLEGERKMYRISDADNSLDMEDVEGDISVSNCDTDAVMIINTGQHCFVWVGSGASVDERKNAMSYACNYIGKTETPWLPISVVAQGKESKLFLEQVPSS